MVGGFPGGSVVKSPPANAGDSGSIPGSGRSPGEGSGNPLQYSCQGNPMDREPDGLQSMKSPKSAGHNLVTKQQCVVAVTITTKTASYYL